ncbi:MAG: hypothetical protein SWC96_03940 [Thermodesulfobacteriota bacterium]|nr:hypothetical protein [Thermodesulfobacteriota bacterium]
MNLKNRIEQLERISVANEDSAPKVILVDRKDARKSATDLPEPFMAILPGIPDGPNGKTLFREPDEPEAAFRARAQQEAGKILKTQN